ncbi:MAG: MBL fold metallo-hydrolase [Melioribacteraceae bacterium]|nr:MBL fold metallo-hydrolase [Melioribacteraceae bacterium]
MKLKFYGTRGSIPVCEGNFQKYGGNTTCVALCNDENIYIFDAGTGIRYLGRDYFTNVEHSIKNIFLTFSHFHWDHIQGFPFFLPAYDSKRDLTITTIGRNDKYFDLKAIFENQMRKEFFPVPLEEMGAKINFIQEETNSFQDANTKIISTEHNHPGGAYSFRIELDGKVVVFITDVEHSDGLDQRVVDIAKDADILIHEAQYTPEELKHHRGWGHSSWMQAIEVAKAANVKKLFITHHDPDHDDQFLDDIEIECKKHFHNVELAQDNLEVEL